MSCYGLSGDRLFLTKAEQLGEKFLPAFNTQSGIPYTSVNLASGKASSPGNTSVLISMANGFPC